MRGGSPTSQLWSNILIDAIKDMGGFGLTNVGDVTIGANKLKTTNLLLKQLDVSSLTIRTAADDDDKNLKLQYLDFTFGLRCTAHGRAIEAANADDAALLLKARDTGVGLVEIARLQGAVDPYLQATLPMVLKPAAIPGALVEGHFGYDSVADRLWFRDTASTRNIPQITSGTYNGDSSVNRAIAHGLGATPKIVIILDGAFTYFRNIIAGMAFIAYTNATANGGLAVTAMTATNFYVGNATDYSQSGNGAASYFWVAIG